MAAPFDIFLDNATHVVELLQLYDEKNAGKKNHHTHEILTKSSVVMFVACWEVFLEDAAQKALEFMVAKISSPKSLPKELRRFVSTELKNDKNDLKIWELAGDGWKEILLLHYSSMLNKHLGQFNTPKAGNVDNLFQTVLGIDHLSSCWSWKNMTNEKAKRKLSDAISLRGSIAHRVQTSDKVTSALANSIGSHLIFLSIKTNNRIRSYIHSITGEYPWSEESYNSVK